MRQLVTDLSQHFDFEVEEAIEFLVRQVQESGNNSKPITLHSIRVAVYLYEQGCGRDVVIAALLHDILEDTETKIEEIEKLFGKRVAELVEATTFDLKIEDYLEKTRDTFKRAQALGHDALIIRAADILDNSYYFFLGTTEQQNRGWKKGEMFLQIAQDKIGEEKVFQDLLQQRQRIEQYK